MEHGAGQILLVEDFPGLSSVVVRMLSRAGYDVSVAESGEAALDLMAGGCQPDILMTDISLPGMTGLELIDQVRRAWPGIKVLVVSGSHDHEASIASLEGSIRFLPKPYRTREVLQILKLFMEAPSPPFPQTDQPYPGKAD
jgi:DNA-binding response OmpR family regulator